jgi:nitroreductase
MPSAPVATCANTPISRSPGQTLSASSTPVGGPRPRATGSRGTLLWSPSVRSWRSWQRCGRARGTLPDPTIAFVVRQPEDARQQDLLMYDLGQATASIMLAAADLGIGSGHAAVSDQEQAQRVLGFPDGYFCAYLIGLGYPADRRLRPLVRPNRRPLDEVVHWDRW